MHAATLSGHSASWRLKMPPATSLNERRGALHVSGLLGEGMLPRYAQLVLIESGHRPGNRARDRRRVMPFEKHLLKRCAGGLFDYEHAYFAQISNGPDHGISFLARLGHLRQRLQQSISFLPVIVAIDLEVAPQSLAFLRQCFAGAHRVFERCPQFGPVTRWQHCPIFDMPLPVCPLARKQQRIEKARRSGHHSAQSGKLAVIGKYLHQHLKAGNEADGFKATPPLWDLLLRIHRAYLPPQPLSRPCVGVNQARHPLVPFAMVARFGDAQSILQDATRRRLTAPESKGNAIPDLNVLPGNGFQMRVENLEHYRRISGNLELWEIGIV